MVSTLALLLTAAAIASPSDPLANLNFAAADLSQWEGVGFGLKPLGASSDDAKGQALLYRSFTVPSNQTAIRFSAAAVRPNGVKPGPILDVYLEGAERRLIAKQVREGDEWKPAGQLLPPLDGAFREYRWNLNGLEGQLVRIVLLDQDDRPGCYVLCGGFKFVPREGGAIEEFASFMVELTREHQLAPMARFDSKHFTALSNGDDEYVEHRLHNCETIYDLFYPHFRAKGFTVREPRGKMMVAIFDSQAGFESYLGQKMPSSVTGIYHTPTNRLVVYDYAGNRAFVEAKKKGARDARQINHDLSRQQHLGTIDRKYADYRNDLNVGTIMHEVAHQLSFNGGLLNREGDGPVWLVEGLACYCESTNNGAWGGVGEPNPGRAGTLASVFKRGGNLIPLRDLVANDDWLRKARSPGMPPLGYAQSWGLFRMLMEDRPKDLKKFMAQIYSRRTTDHRLQDFAECFGTDLDRFERQYVSYLRKVAASEAKPQEK